MPLNAYGVLIATPVERRRESSRDTPHFQIHAVAGGDEHYRIAVNVLSQQAPSELLYLVDEDLRHPVTAELPASRRAGTRSPRNRAEPASTSSGRTSSTRRGCGRSRPTCRARTTISPICSTTT